MNSSRPSQDVIVRTANDPVYVDVMYYCAYCQGICDRYPQDMVNQNLQGLQTVAPPSSTAGPSATSSSPEETRATEGKNSQPVPNIPIDPVLLEEDAMGNYTDPFASRIFDLSADGRWQCTLSNS